MKQITTTSSFFKKPPPLEKKPKILKHAASTPQEVHLKKLEFEFAMHEQAHEQVHDALNTAEKDFPRVNTMSERGIAFRRAMYHQAITMDCNTTPASII